MAPDTKLLLVPAAGATRFSAAFTSAAFALMAAVARALWRSVSTIVTTSRSLLPRRCG